MIKASVLACAAAACFAPACALAAVTSAASFGPLSIQLFDLNPGDSIAPSISFLSSGSDTSTYALATTAWPYAYDMQAHTGVTAWEPGTSVAAAGVSLAGSSIGGLGQAEGTTLSAWGATGNFTGPFAFDSSVFQSATQAPTLGAFTLSANTIMVLSGLATVSASGTASTVFEEYATASAYINLYGLGGGGGGSQTATDQLSAGGYGTMGAFNYASSRLLSVSFVNQTTSDMTGSLQLMTSASGYVYATPVPEPASQGLLLLGLALGGLGLLRRSA